MAKWIYMVLIVVGLKFGLQEAAEIHMQIMAPERSHTENDITSAINTGIYEANGGKRNYLRDMYNIFFESSVYFIDNEFPPPSSLTGFFCNETFAKNSSVILSINYDTLTSVASEYVIDVALQLGYPVLSWDPFYTGTAESNEDRLFLQLAPTIQHECEAMILLMERYNWTEFSIVTTQDVGHEFIQGMERMVKQTSVQQGYLLKPRFINIATVVLDYGKTEGFLTDKQEKHVRDKLHLLVKMRSRIILFHSKQEETINIIEVAQSMGLIGSRFAWVLTTSSIGEINLDFSPGTILPEGLLAISQNRSVSKIEEAISTAIKLFKEGIADVVKEGYSYDELYPHYSCEEKVNISSWKLGTKIHSVMKSTEINAAPPSTRRSSSLSRLPSSRAKPATSSLSSDALPVSFTDNGIIKYSELNLLNIRRSETKSRRDPPQKWNKVGRIFPKVEGSDIKLNIDIDGIVWPGSLPNPPRGKPEKRFFRIATRKEEPFVIFVPPEENGECGQHSVRCLINETHGTSNVSFSNGTVSYCCTGLCIEVLEKLKQELHFDYILYEVPDGQWGVKNHTTGEWNGLIRELIDDKADMVMTNFIIDETRLSVIDFSTPYLESGVTIMVSIRKGAISPYAFLEPYDFYSWILILIFSVHATGASIFIFEWLSPSGLDQGKTSTVEHKFSLFRSFWLIWAMLFGAAVSIDVPRGVSSRFLANVWALFALVFLASYTANLAAFMITIDEYYDLSGIEDWRLLNPTRLTPHFKFATIADTSTESILRTTYPKMHKYMSKYSQSDVLTAKHNLKNHSIHAFIYDANVLEYTAGRDETCSLLTVGRWYAMSGYGVGFPRGSTLKEEVNRVILSMQHSGDIERLQAFWLSGACHAKKDKKDKTSNKIGILNFISAFILLAAGVLLGVILLVLEHLYFKSGRKCLKKYDKCGCCALVSLSMGKSLTFEQSVFEAIDIQRRHKCKDPICEMNIWKARHQLDIALLKIKNMQKAIDELHGEQEASSSNNQTYPMLPSSTATAEC
ncbi:Glutamate receptor ionotropic [Mactra antiquata]